jgi:AcrR family transcriptional regulator
MTSASARLTTRDETRTALVEVAGRLLADGGPAAVTTRAVAAAAGVQAPTIYRLFGDKDGLLEAVAEHVFATYVAGKAARVDDGDPIADLRAGWDVHVEFGVANPAVFALLADPRRTRSPAAEAGLRILQARVHRVAAAGRLRMAEAQAVALIQAAGTGVVLTLIATPAGQRHPGLADAMYDAVMRSVLTEAPGLAEGDTVSAAVALRASLPRLAVLSTSEQALLGEWLDRISH